MTAEPQWTIPLEIVRACVTGTAAAMMYRAQAQSAKFMPEARVFIRGGHLVAVIDFARPIGPEKQGDLAVMLAVHLEENGPGAAQIKAVQG